jgi:RIO kinase 2
LAVRSDFIVRYIITLTIMAVSAEHIRTLHKYEKTILSVLERQMTRYAWVPLEQLIISTGFSESEVNYRLARLIEWGMVRFNPVPYDGYALVFGGYDTLALESLTRKGTISALGMQLGEGKESVVYEALGLGPVAIKFHRVGGRSFNSARVNREYMTEGGHCPWLIASKLSAEREYKALTTLHPKVSVPLPIAQNRHTVVMALIQGANLNRCRLEAPADVLDEILSKPISRNITFSWKTKGACSSIGPSGQRHLTRMQSLSLTGTLITSSRILNGNTNSRITVRMRYNA